MLRGRAALGAEDGEAPAAVSSEGSPHERSLQMQVIDVNRTVKVTKGGSLQRFSALVVVGNGDGVVGWAMGKAPEVAAAVDKAYARAARSLFFFQRFEGHTVFHESAAKYGRSLVQLSPLPSGSGLKANDTVRGRELSCIYVRLRADTHALPGAQIAAVCRLAGIKDIRAKVIGSHNPHTTLRAGFEALDAVRSPEEVAAARGRTVIRTS
jgi:small subunit ribosomal protein S5